MDKLSERVQGTATLEVETSSKSIPWADQTDLVADLPLLPRWPDDEEDDENIGETREPYEVSESTSALLKKSFTSTLPHVERRKLRGMFHVPNVDETRCPRLDLVFKTTGLSLREETKAFEQDLARVQAFALNPVGPLVQLLEVSQSGTLEQDEAIATLSVAITLLGNASSQISRIRRRKALKELNADIQDLADKEEIFKEAAPKLFGNGFERTAKERAEAVKLLKGHILLKSHKLTSHFLDQPPLLPPEGRRLPIISRGKNCFHPFS